MALDAVNQAYATDEVRELVEGLLRAKRDEATRLGRARKEGKAEGIAEGKAEGKVEVAKRMRADGVDAETIFKFTGVRLE